jgi:hypothetical protein
MATDPGGANRMVLSRRSLVGAAATAPLMLDASTARAGACVELARRWIVARTSTDYWLVRWSRLEARLDEHHRWYGLSPEQREALDAAKELVAIDARLDLLVAEQAQLLAQLTATPTTDLGGAVAKLAVVVQLILPEETPEAHRLITGVWCELSALEG